MFAWERWIGVGPFYLFVLRCIISLTFALGTITLLTLSYRFLREKYHAKRKRPDHGTPFRTSVELFLISSHLNDYITFSQGLLSVASVVVYIYGTYQTDTPTWYLFAVLTFATFFALNWMLEFYLSKNRLIYAFSGLSIVDILTIAPVFWDLASGTLAAELEFRDLMRAICILRLLRLHKLLPYVKHEIYRAVLHSAINVFSLVFCVSGIQIVIELNSNTSQTFMFHESVYWCIVTMATVGYGDVHPNTAEGMFVTDFLILLSIVLIPFEVSVISNAIASFTPAKRDLSSSAINRHVLVCGDIGFSNLLEFLAEIYSQQRGKMKMQVVVLCPRPMSPEISALLQHPFYSNRVIYLEGSATSSKDLARAKVSRAEACFIFSPSHWSATDAETAMAALSLREACTGYKVFAQIIDAESRSKIMACGVSQHLCREEWRMALLAQSCLCPGLSTLLSNLFASRPRIFQRELWLREYTWGSLHSIYRVLVPDVLFGKKFSDAVLFFYFGMRCLPLGVETVETQRPSIRQLKERHKHHVLNLKRHVLLNPTDMELSAGDVLYVVSPSTRSLALQEDLDPVALDEMRHETHMVEIEYLPTGIINPQDPLPEDLAAAATAAAIATAGSTSLVNSYTPSASLDLPKPESQHHHGLKRAPSVLGIVESTFESAQLKLARRMLSPYQVLPDDLPPAYIDINNSSRLRSLLDQEESENENAKENARQENSGKPELSKLGSQASASSSGSQSEFHQNPEVPKISRNSSTTSGWSQAATDSTNVLEKVCETAYAGDWKKMLGDAQTMKHGLSVSQQNKDQEEEDDKPRSWGITKSSTLPDLSTLTKSTLAFPNMPTDSLTIDGIELTTEAPPHRTVDEIVASLSGHIVVCGGIQALELFVKPLRASHLFQQKPIVILCPEEPSDEDWAYIARYPEIYLIQGTAKKASDLRRVNVESAERVVILSDPFTERETNEEADRDVVLAHLELQSVLPDYSKVIVELVNESNMRFMMRRRKTDGSKAAMAQAMAEKNMAQTKPVSFLAPDYASGRVCSFSFLDSLFCKAYFQDYLFDLAYDFTFGLNMPRGDRKCKGPGDLLPDDKFLTQMDVPQELAGLPFGDLVKDFVNHRGLLPLGLYRCKEATGAPVPYVFTCPQDSAPVHPDDKIFVISGQPPG